MAFDEPGPSALWTRGSAGRRRDRTGATAATGTDRNGSRRRQPALAARRWRRWRLTALGLVRRSGHPGAAASGARHPAASSATGSWPGTLASSDPGPTTVGAVGSADLTTGRTVRRLAETRAGRSAGRRTSFGLIRLQPRNARAVVRLGGWCPAPCHAPRRVGYRGSPGPRALLARPIQIQDLTRLARSAGQGAGIGIGEVLPVPI